MSKKLKTQNGLPVSSSNLLADWERQAICGTRGDMVWAILHDWRRERVAYEKLCKIYFDIGAKSIGEDEVRRQRDEAIIAMANIGNRWKIGG